MSSAGIAALSPTLSESVLSPNNLLGQLGMESKESIWIYLSVGGSMIRMRVFQSESIESVKMRIQSSQSFLVGKQKLVCGGRELARSNSLLREYGVGDGNVVHVVLRLNDLRVIRVQTSCGKEYTFHVERGRDVAYVKQKIAKKEKECIDLEEHEVMCDGQPLEDQKVIEDICNRHDAVIHLFYRKSAKVRPRPVDKNLELSIVASQVNDQKEHDFLGDIDGKRHDTVEKKCKKSYESNREIVPRKPSDRNISLEPIIVNPKIELPVVIWNMINSASDGLESGHLPIRSLEGTGGAYFMLDSMGKKYISVFKPIDEEPMAQNNPRGLPLSVDGEGLKKGTTVGEGALREVAAYLLDHPLRGRRSLFGDERGFAGVLPTVLAKCLHKGFNHPGDISVKIGSLQMFMENDGSCEDIGPGSFPVMEVHKISVLDIRLANADRHAGNILLSKGGAGGETLLIPIDHGYCLPTSFEDCTFEWLYWPQARQPYSPEVVEYIKSLDAEEDIALLKFHGWDLPLECARTLRISTMLLKKGVDRELTPFDIGSIMCRQTLTKKSVLEEIVQESLDSVLPGTSEAAFLETVSEIMNLHLDQIAGA